MRSGLQRGLFKRVLILPATSTVISGDGFDDWDIGGKKRADNEMHAAKYPLVTPKAAVIGPLSEGIRSARRSYLDFFLVELFFPSVGSHFGMSIVCFFLAPITSIPFVPRIPFSGIKTV
jgi:hypothetical protein